MNRKQRRLLEKQGKLVTKEPVYNIKQSDIEEINKKAASEAVDIGFALMLALPVYILKKKWGFGRKRIERFTDQIIHEYEEYISEGYVSLEDMHQYIKDETGIEIKQNFKG